jgi:hypothetical protein
MRIRISVWMTHNFSFNWIKRFIGINLIPIDIDSWCDGVVDAELQKSNDEKSGFF